MTLIAPAHAIVEPSFMEPGLILPYAQASGAFDLLATGSPLVKLGDGDLFVYARKIDLRTTMALGQASYEQLPSINVALSLISTASYLLRIRAEWTHHDASAASRWSVAINELYRLGGRQAINQLLRIGLLYGFNPANGEGLINTQGATLVNLPPDTNGDTTIVTYDNGQLAQFVLSQVLTLKTNTMQLGMGQVFCICGPQRVLGQMAYPNIVQLVQFQREGAGSTTTAGVIKDVLDKNEDKILWLYDDTLIGKGTGGNDAIIITMPEVKKPVGEKINTNIFAELAPGIEACTAQYMDMAAPREIPTPIPGGAIDVLMEQRATSGWAIRPQAVLVISAQYQ